jgi:hypothetical protein
MCSDSYYSTLPGTVNVLIPVQTICKWEIDLREYTESSRIDMNFVYPTENKVKSIKLSYKVFIISYTIPYKSKKPDLSQYTSYLYLFQTTSITLTGNYIVLGYWYDSNTASNLKFSWSINNSSNTTQISILLGSILSSLVLVCLFGCCYSYYKRKLSNRRVSADIPYRSMNGVEDIDASEVHKVLPFRYYLVNDKVPCPICFDE